MHSPIIHIADFLPCKLGALIAEYRGVEIKRTTMAHWCGPLEFCRNLIAPTGGGGWWSINTIAEAVSEIDKAVASSGKPADWSYSPGPVLPPAGSDRISLKPSDLLAIAGKSPAKILRISQAIQNPALQIVEGWPLMSWRMDSAPGVIRFSRVSDDGQVQCAIGFINAPESRQSEFCPPQGQLPFPTEFIMLG